MNALVIPMPVLPPTAPEIVEKLCEIQHIEMQGEQVPIYTEHLIHASMYSRTITMPPHVKLIGALMKIPTLVTVIGKALVLVGKDVAEIDGYAVLPGSAGRKQIFISGEGPVIITMCFPTSARTVQEAEMQFTDEWDILLSNRQGFNKADITEEA
jgi:hypothetical protein